MSSLYGILQQELQSGIYYGKPRIKNSSSNGKLPVNSSFALVSLRASRRSNAFEIGKCLNSLWKIYKDLEKGIITDPPNCRVNSGSLSVLIGYGPKVFELPGARKQIPLDMKYKQFHPALSNKPILRGSGIEYSKRVCNNLALNDHVVVQLISESQLATNRALVETWRQLRTELSGELHIASFYTGFRRDDGRSWLGFHDEISNLTTPKEREVVIKIDAMNNNLRREDTWTEGGTYLAFLRIEIDLERWWKIETKRQEIIVGRDKLNGFPLIGIDKKGDPVMYPAKSRSSYRSPPKHFSDQIINHPDYYKDAYLTSRIRSNLDTERSIKSLNESHIGRTRHMDKVDSKYTSSRRIFRQGFDFLEFDFRNPTKRARVGLNFVSYQNDAGRLLFILTDPSWLGNTNFGGPQNGHRNNKLISVLASGLFFAPPDGEPFPGSNIFL